MEGRDIDPAIAAKLPENVRHLFKSDNGGLKKNVSVSDIVEVIDQSNDSKVGDMPDKSTKSYFR